MTKTIILTGAICPSFPVVRNDPQTRLVDYLCAIRRWLNVQTLDRVIYCDASGCTIPESIFESEKFESLTMDASEHALNYEAGRAEAECMQFVFENSRKPIGSFYKCTGRLFVQNFEPLQDAISQHVDSPLFLRRWTLHHSDWADTRFFKMEAAFFQKTISPRILELTGRAFRGLVIEALFGEYCSQAIAFPEPHYVGHCGHDGCPYAFQYTANEIQVARKLLVKFGTCCFLRTHGLGS